ncbi:UNVERIFIED_CONTAM: Structural maintenance of chromosomes flexible hinge domain-containing protein GMI1 [Sesamum latifolium]|uniref:Structural maintenance of chromosomes flexible hinge domain-containing protein GMI1 n=1 Tax=Sesamum latifolium TaxID=2727402 RepID=A0AAW2T7K9_9LAMI
MYSKTPQSLMNKRPSEDSSTERPRKSPYGVLKVEDDAGEAKIFKFRVLLPNGTTLELKLSELRNEMPIEEFVGVMKREYFNVAKQRRSREPKRAINWKYQDLYFTDVHANKMRIKVNFQDFMPNTWHFLWLHDGSAEPDAYEEMWDLTPDTDLLKELPDDYTFETALADLIDNSLQALWSNGKFERKLIRYEIAMTRNGWHRWEPGEVGKNGSIFAQISKRESYRGQTPISNGNSELSGILLIVDLHPFFGMFGYGGPVATMCLGRRAIVSSKTKNCKKVFTLHLEREALVSSSRSESCWKTKGGIRDPLEDEKENSRHGSFMKVEIFEPKMKIRDIKHLRCQLKDIYFPYIQQIDSSYGPEKTWDNVQVNGEDLVGIRGGEVATTNLHSCNGPNFVLQLHFSNSQDTSMLGQSQKVCLEANARLKCVYFPIVKGEESIQRIIEELEADGCGIRESYESFSRVSPLLPFMEPKQKVGEKAQILRRCCSRVKCLIDTDSGFNPTPNKTDLAHHHPYTKALKNFGNRAPDNEKDVQIEISRDGKKLTLAQLEKQYNDWVSEMHVQYDEEIDGGLDQATLVVVSSEIKKLGISSDVVRVHEKIEWKGTFWAAGQKIKVLKGACPGCHKNNVFATLQYIILQGLQGDACGEARLICRPLGLPEDKGCQLLVENGNRTIDIRDSLSLPIRVIDSGKCLPVDDTEWANKLQAYCQKLPSAIDLLSHIDCHDLEIDGGLPADVVQAGDAPPENIVAVIRPKAFNPGNSSKRLDQKFIVRDCLDMSLEVNLRAGGKNVGRHGHIYSVRIPPSSHKGLHGLYVFPLKSKWPDLFQKAGSYALSFSLNGSRDLRFEHIVRVQAAANVGSWKVTSHKPDPIYTVRCKANTVRCYATFFIYWGYNNNVVFIYMAELNLAIFFLNLLNRVGSCFEPLSIACYDRYNNKILFTSVPKLIVKLVSNSAVLAQVRTTKVDVTADKLTVKLKGIAVKSSKLDEIRPTYEAALSISTLDEEFSVAFPCRVIPGNPQKIIAHPRKLKMQLIPGHIVEGLALEVFDEYGNHAKEDEEISLSVDGFSFQDGSSILHNGGVMYCVKKVAANGFVDLSNTLKVSKGYGKDVLLSASFEKRVIFRLDFQTEKREIRTASKVFKNCEAGSQLENMVFEVVNPEGEVDESIHDEEKHGQSHTLTIKSNSFDIDDSVRYSFRHGRCAIRSIPLPHKEGIFSFSAAHSRYPELNLDIEVNASMQVHVEKTRQENYADIGNHENGHPILSPQNSCQGNLLILPHSPALKVPEVVNRSLSPQSSSRYVLPIGYLPSPRTPKLESTNSLNENSDVSPIQELEDDLASCGLRKMDRDRNIGILDDRRKHIKQHITVLQASIDLDLRNASRTCAKELIQKQIESKSQSASAVICRLHEEVPFESRSQDILGIVALLGTVESIELSRILAQYLGEDQMRAIVCKNYAAAHCLETNTLHKLATKFGKSVSGGYLALCLEDIRPITSEPSSNPQELLPLKKPTLPNGYVPQGFMGYAVNMISIEASYLRWRTKSGHGLRETLFYRLFGDLQVYRNRDCMMTAQSCIQNGAVSLDGGVMRGNGLVSLGHWEPDILFPVKDKAPTPQSLKSLQMLERRKRELTELNRQIDEENKALEQDRKNLEMSRDRTDRMAASNPELARDAVNSQGLCVIGGYMSPVNDSYKKKGLIHAEHRIAMCNLACQSSDFVMVDPWEVKTSLCESGVVSNESLKVMLVCGSDLLESFSIPGFWIREQVKTICRDFGLICIRRGGQDVQSIISKDDILNEYKNNIIVVDEVVPNGISSTGLRDCISRGLSVKYLTADEVIDYIKQNGLYKPE